MAHSTTVYLANTRPMNTLLETGKSYCSDHLGRFFQNKYSPPALEHNKFEIPSQFAAHQPVDGLAICVMMNNHITHLKYFNEIFADWNEETLVGSVVSGTTVQTEDAKRVEALTKDERLISVIRTFKKINDEIVIGRCKGLEFTPI